MMKLLFLIICLWFHSHAAFGWVPHGSNKVAVKTHSAAAAKPRITTTPTRRPILLPLSLENVEEPSPAPMSNKQDHLISALSGNAEVVVKAITCRNLVQDALIKQDLRPLAADALGRVMTCTLLCAAGLKDEETLQMTFAGDGPLQGVMAITDGSGVGVRGYVGNGMIELGTQHTSNDVAKGIGKGLLKVVRNHPTYIKPYNGVVALRNSQVAMDVAGYLRDSEQSDSVAISCGVQVNGALVRQAGGYLIETLPGASIQTIKQCALNVGKLMGQSEDPALLLANGLTPAGICEALLEDLGGIGSLKLTTPEYKCHCSNERVFRALRLLGKDEVKDIIAKNEVIEVKCEFCMKVYTLSPDQIEQELDIQIQ